VAADELREERRELLVVRVEGAGDEEVALGDADQDAGADSELAGKIGPGLGQEDPCGVAAVAGGG
jgi:hypothetical protein